MAAIESAFRDGISIAPSRRAPSWRANHSRKGRKIFIRGGNGLIGKRPTRVTVGRVRQSARDPCMRATVAREVLPPSSFLRPPGAAFASGAAIHLRHLRPITPSRPHCRLQWPAQ